MRGNGRVDDIHLIKFLDSIYTRPSQSIITADAKAAFRQYLLSMQIEYVNYATFELKDNFTLQNGFADTNMPSSWIDEYLEKSLHEDDYVLRRIADLNSHNSLSSFGFGEDMVKNLKGGDRVSAPVLRGAADAGMKDAIGLIGVSPVRGTEKGQHYFAFGLGGEKGVGNHIQKNIHQIRIAACALIDRLRPEFEAVRAGFQNNLTPREYDVLCGISEGAHREQIGFKLGISVATVDMHLHNLRRKLQAQTLSEAVARGFRFGILH